MAANAESRRAGPTSIEIGTVTVTRRNTLHLSLCWSHLLAKNKGAEGETFERSSIQFRHHDRADVSHAKPKPWTLRRAPVTSGLPLPVHRLSFASRSSTRPANAQLRACRSRDRPYLRPGVLSYKFPEVVRGTYKVDRRCARSLLLFRGLGQC